MGCVCLSATPDYVVLKIKPPENRQNFGGVPPKKDSKRTHPASRRTLDRIRLEPSSGHVRRRTSPPIAPGPGSAESRSALESAASGERKRGRFGRGGFDGGGGGRGGGGGGGGGGVGEDGGGQALVEQRFRKQQGFPTNKQAELLHFLERKRGHSEAKGKALPSERGSVERWHGKGTA